MQTILGQPRALRMLQAALRLSRVHHAWIFSGPRGVGKFTTAVEFAKIVLDPDAGPDLSGEISSDPDGRTATLVDAGTHPDLHVIRKELALHSANPDLRTRKLTNLPLDVLREWIIGGRTQQDAPAYRTASLGHGKVFIIDEAELIDENGQNALLKTLEEPPADTYFMLVSARPERLLPTIHSRCEHARFSALDDDALHTWFDRGTIEVTDGDRPWLENFCEGSPGLAVLATGYDFAAWQTTLDPMLAALDAGRFPPDLGTTLAALIDEFAAAWVKKNPLASKDAANKDGASHLLGLLAANARCRLAAEADDPDAATHWASVIDLVRDTERALASNVNMKHALENLVVQWARK